MLQVKSLYDVRKHVSKGEQAQVKANPVACQY